MPQRETLRVLGLKELLIAADNAGRDIKFSTRATFRTVGDIVKEDAALKLSSISSRSAAGYKTRVRRTGVAVEQSLRKTTGTRPDWGTTQMRKALLPAQEENQERVLSEFDKAMDKVCDRFERTP